MLLAAVASVHDKHPVSTLFLVHTRNNSLARNTRRGHSLSIRDDNLVAYTEVAELGQLLHGCLPDIAQCLRGVHMHCNVFRQHTAVVWRMPVAEVDTDGDLFRATFLLCDHPWHARVAAL